MGAPKTGTTFVQRVLRQNTEALTTEGFCYPIRRHGEHRLMAMDLRQIGWGGRRAPRAEGKWDEFVERALAWDGHTVVLSNELLGGVTEDQARRAVQSLQPAEVHVVFTARDLARQLPSDWQEQVKHQHTVTLERFVDDLVEFGIEAPRPFGQMFWGLHDPVRVLGNWCAAVPRERTHIITVPQPGAPPDTLWRRFASVVGLDADACDTDVTRANTSMGRAESELLRQINSRVGKRLRHHYDPLVRTHVAETVLAARSSSPRAVLPEKHAAWADQRSRQMIDGIKTAGYPVIGDLQDLLPATATRDSALPEDTEPEELLDASVDCLAALLERVRDLRDERAREASQRGQAEEADRLRRELAELRTATNRPVRFAVSALVERHPLPRWLRAPWKPHRKVTLKPEESREDARRL